MVLRDRVILEQQLDQRVEEGSRLTSHVSCLVLTLTVHDTHGQRTT